MSASLTRAYSALTVKTVDNDARTFTGIASTPETDRSGDVMEPTGAQFKLPIPILLHHNPKEPIGFITAAKVTSRGIEVIGKLTKWDEPGRLKDRLDLAWQEIKSGLLRGLSVGFKPIEAARIQGSFGTHFLKWLWVEISAVTLPDNASATILTIKSLDSHRPAASGTGRVKSLNPGDSGSSKATHMKNVSEQITEKRTLLQAKSARLEELMADQDTNGGLEGEQEKELATITGEVDALTKSIASLETLERAQLLGAKRVEAPAGTLADAPARTKIEVKALPKGTLFVRYAAAIAQGKGSMSDSLAYAKMFSGTPEVLACVKAHFTKAIPGTAVVGSPAWGGELVNPDTASTEFVELLMPKTIIGRVPGFDAVPFNIPIIEQTGGSTFNWVGEGAPKGVGELAFERTTMSYSKVAGIVVLTDELVRLSSPSAEAKVREDMTKQCAKFLDEQFIRVAVTAGANNPASITNGVSAPNATGVTAAALKHDLNIALATFDSANVGTGGLVIVMTPALARGISLLSTSIDTPAFPGMTPEGGTLLGYPVIVSGSVDSGTIVIFQPSEILMANDGRVTIDASNQASLDMSGSTNATFSLWQNNCVGLRAEQWIRWQKKRASGIVALIDTAAYAPA